MKYNNSEKEIRPVLQHSSCRELDHQGKHRSFHGSSQRDSTRQGAIIHLQRSIMVKLSDCWQQLEQYYTCLNTTAVQLVLHDVPGVGDPIVLSAVAVVLHSRIHVLHNLAAVEDVAHLDNYVAILTSVSRSPFNM